MKQGTRFTARVAAIVALGGFLMGFDASVISGGIDFTMFVLASIVSRSARFFLEAWLLRRFGEPIRDFVEKRLGLISLVFCVVLIGGFVAIKYLI